jgi:toxin-antitoxin system PIN domain toxin
VIVPDINLLIYANINCFVQHRRALSWFSALLNGDEPVGLTAPAIYGFLRLATHPRLFDPPMSVQDAVSRVRSWLALPHIHFLAPGPRHLEISFQLLLGLGSASSLTTATELAAYAMENQAELHSNDTGFGRFSGLRWRNPIGI